MYTLSNKALQNSIFTDNVHYTQPGYTTLPISQFKEQNSGMIYAMMVNILEFSHIRFSYMSPKRVLLILIRFDNQIYRK